MEYAVFDAEEAKGGKIERFEVLIDRQDIGGLAESVRLETYRERDSALARPDLLERLCLLLWTAHERWERGERLSSQRYIQSSVDLFLDLLTAHGCMQSADKLDARRRLERVEPETGRELSRIATLGPAEAGVALLELAEKRLRAWAPDLAWERASVVRGWLQEAVRAA